MRITILCHEGQEWHGWIVCMADIARYLREWPSAIAIVIHYSDGDRSVFY